MKITIQKKNIEDIIKSISRISLKGIIHPALKLSRINISDNKLKISATNLALAVVVTIDIEQNDTFECFVDTVSLERILSGMSDSDEVFLNFNDKFIEVNNRKAKARIPYQEGEDVPNIPVVSGTNITLPASNFKKSISVVLPSASTTDIKPELSSIFLNFKDNSIISVATDAFQLMEYINPVTINKENSFLLPAKESADILKIIDNIDGALSAVYTDTLFEIKTKNISVITKLTQGLFPDYTTIIPKDSIGNVSFLRNDLDMAIKFLMQLKSNKNHINFKTNENSIIFTTSNIDGGDSEYTIDASIEGDAFNGSIMAVHLRNLVNAIPGDSINIAFYGSQKPFLATSLKGNNFRYLMMPISAE